MGTKQEGYIKFTSNWEKTAAGYDLLAGEINQYRSLLYDKNLIGKLDNGVGFGNMSIRIEGTNTFLITGTATGNHRHLLPEHFALVYDFETASNRIDCRGLTIASSESLTHAVIYSVRKDVNSVIHIHHKTLWERYNGILPTTSPAADYGTREIAEEVSLLAQNTKVSVIVMGGHMDGIIFFAPNTLQACHEILKLVDNIKLDY
jgi:ribulose-5-phosphate 4-epimerase/fuculose-1-phosphate aldolase